MKILRGKEDHQKGFALWASSISVPNSMMIRPIVGGKMSVYGKAVRQLLLILTVLETAPVMHHSLLPKNTEYKIKTS